jgi:hypothetical protein
LRTTSALITTEEHNLKLRATVFWGVCSGGEGIDEEEMGLATRYNGRISSPFNIKKLELIVKTESSNYKEDGCL